jgi:hypothetical protein
MMFVQIIHKIQEVISSGGTIDTFSGVPTSNLIEIG